MSDTPREVEGLARVLCDTAPREEHPAPGPPSPPGSGPCSYHLARARQIIARGVRLVSAGEREPRPVAGLEAERLSEMQLLNIRLRAERGYCEHDDPATDVRLLLGHLATGERESGGPMRAVLNWATDIETILAAIFAEGDDERSEEDNKVLYDSLRDVRRELAAAAARVKETDTCLT
jgi:hypothetical protein